MSKKFSPAFPNRVRFNWGFHDAASESARGYARLTSMTDKHSLRVVSHAFDPAYYFGYTYGLDAVKAKLPTDLSDAAWTKSQLDGCKI